MRKSILWFIVILGTLVLCACTAPAPDASQPAPESADPAPTRAAQATAVPEDTASSAMAAEETPPAQGDSSEQVKALAEELFRAMWEPYIDLKPFERPDFVEDNAKTRLSMKWPEYFLAYIEKHPGNRLVSLDAVEVSAQKGEDGLWRGTAEIRFTREDAAKSGVNGVNVAFEMELGLRDGQASVKALELDLLFATDYGRMKEELENRAKGGGATVAMVDSVVEAAIRNIE
ncbi:MAG: alpha/beta hydrolase family protein [Christensenellaceae bacterium]|jgi:hypothetical protein|nr:alpha/beta hydrolase family protein [Christensenellaceae bacterium]